MSYCVYILWCADGTLYTGITNNTVRRVAAHNSGKGAKYTRSRVPVEIVYCEDCSDKSAALHREFEIKQMTKDAKRRLIAEGSKYTQAP